MTSGPPRRAPQHRDQCEKFGDRRLTHAAQPVAAATATATAREVRYAYAPYIQNSTTKISSAHLPLS
ncbi:hypothetical protein [Streptomyces sp. NPDC005141]